MTRDRAAWCKFTTFSSEQRASFRAVLKADSKKTDVYLDRVETLVPDYVMGTSMILDEPLETAKQARDLLNRISRLAHQLHDALYELDPRGSEHILDMASIRVPNEVFDYWQLRDQLAYLRAIAHGAARLEPPNKVSHRRPDYATNYFISGCVKHFEEVFGEPPRYSKGTKFQKFLIAVSHEVCRPEIALRGDLTRRIKSVL